MSVSSKKIRGVTRCLTPAQRMAATVAEHMRWAAEKNKHKNQKTILVKPSQVTQVVGTFIAALQGLQQVGIDVGLFLGEEVYRSDLYHQTDGQLVIGSKSYRKEFKIQLQTLGVDRHKQKLAKDAHLHLGTLTLVGLQEQRFMLYSKARKNGQPYFSDLRHWYFTVADKNGGDVSFLKWLEQFSEQTAQKPPLHEPAAKSPERFSGIGFGKLVGGAGIGKRLKAVSTLD